MSRALVKLKKTFGIKFSSGLTVRVHIVWLGKEYSQRGLHKFVARVTESPDGNVNGRITDFQAEGKGKDKDAAKVRAVNNLAKKLGATVVPNF